MPDNRLPANRPTGQVVQHTQTKTIYQGPLPAPGDFQAYERVLPGAAHRILKMAENQALTGKASSCARSEATS